MGGPRLDYRRCLSKRRAPQPHRWPHPLQPPLGAPPLPGPGGSLAAYADFTAGADAGGPISQTATGGEQAGLPAGAGSAYAPFTGGVPHRLMVQAAQLEAALRTLSYQLHTNPSWPRAFWAEVDRMAPVEPQLATVLSGHGYIGAGSISAPRVDTLLAELERLKSESVPPHGSAAAHLQPVFAAGSTLDAQMSRWDVRLPADMKRAGPEIYKNMRASGVANVREWIRQNYKGSESAPLWTDLWHAATAIDYRLGNERTPQGVQTLLATDDHLELLLRRLAAYVYEKRSHDKTGAMHMLAIQAPGSEVDIAPSWMVSEATTHSKTEYQRAERVKNLEKMTANSGGGFGKDGGKGGGGRGGRGGGKGGRGGDGRGGRRGGGRPQG